MYKTILVEKQIEDGFKLLRALDERGFPTEAALWYQDPDKMTWKLRLASSLESRPGPDPYFVIASAMEGLDLSFSLNDIRLMNPQSREFTEFRRYMEGVVGSAGIRPKDPSKGTAFDDAYIYRWLD